MPLQRKPEYTSLRSPTSPPDAFALPLRPPPSNPTHLSSPFSFSPPAPSPTSTPAISPHLYPRRTTSRLPPLTSPCAATRCPTRLLRPNIRCRGSKLCRLHEHKLEEACGLMFWDWYRKGETARGCTPVRYRMVSGRMIRGWDTRERDKGWVWAEM